MQSIINNWAKNANTSAIKNGRREKGKCKDFKLLLNLIKRILDYAMQLGAISFNPATQVLPPKLKDRRPSTIKYFDNDELKKFLNYLNSLEHTDENVLNSTLYQFLLATGLRIGEALALNWSDINIKNILKQLEYDIGFHGFRHTHASLLMNNDVNPKEIQMRLGHAVYSITMNLYSHLSKDKKKETVERFANILKAL